MRINLVELVFSHGPSLSQTLLKCEIIRLIFVLQITQLAVILTEGLIWQHLLKGELHFFGAALLSNLFAGHALTPIEFCPGQLVLIE